MVGSRSVIGTVDVPLAETIEAIQIHGLPGRTCPVWLIAELLQCHESSPLDLAGFDMRSADSFEGG